MTINLEITKREGDAASVRNEGKVPGIVYGPKQEPISIAIDKQIFTKVLHEAGESTIINLKGLDEDVEVLVHDVNFDRTRGGVSHVDFYAIERGKELTTNVSLNFIGEAPAEKTGFSVNKALHEVEVTCRPSALPSHLDIDLSALDSEEAQILVSDIKLPAGVKVDTDASLVVANINAVHEEEPAEEITESEVEVETKGKKEESGE